MTITKERLLKIQHWRETYGADSNVMLPAEEAAELARIALASLKVAPVGEVSEKRRGLVMDGTVDLGGKSTYRIIKGEKAMKRLPLGTKFYIAPPAPVVDADPVVFTDERNLHHIARGRETSLIWGKQNQEVGDIPLYRHAQSAPVVHQIMRELVSLLDEDQFARIENIALSAGVMPPQPAPVVPEEIPKGLAGQIVSLLAHNIGDKFLAQKIWNACRAAMLQGGENSKSLHAVKAAPVLNYSVKNIELLHADCRGKSDGNSPAIPDGWISCSERMPEQGAYISAVSKHGEYVAGQVIDDWLDLHDGTSFGLDEVYLWMMLPPLLASPQQ
ncbi:DUF551 domain-containing protein [Salmonella enterica subsp. enterica serovar Bredeney]